MGSLTGVRLLVLGLARAGSAIRFIPYPVIGGFLSATGWLMVSGAVRVITDHSLSPSTLATLVGTTTLAQLAAASAVALALYSCCAARSPLLLRAAGRHGSRPSCFRAHRNEPKRGASARLDLRNAASRRAGADLGSRRRPQFPLAHLAGAERSWSTRPSSLTSPNSCSAGFCSISARA